MAANSPATTTVRGAVLTKADETRNTLRVMLNQYKPVFGALLARTGVDEPTFAAWIANACRTTPQLWQCDPNTILGAALKCAQLGLAPNDPRNLAWIIPYGNQAQFQMGYGGYLELCRRAVPGIKFAGRAVYPNDEFSVDYGAEQPLHHVPAVALRKERGGDAFLWYLHLRWPDGTQDVYSLDKEGVEYHRSFSKMKNGTMWDKSYDAAALKSVVLDAKRWLPTSTQLASAYAADDQVIQASAMTDDEPALQLPENTQASDGSLGLGGEQ